MDPAYATKWYTMRDAALTDVYSLNYTTMQKDHIIYIYPIGSMYGIFTYIYYKHQQNVGKYTIHEWYGMYGYS